MKNEVNIFYCYAHEDKDMRNALDIHLSTLRRMQLIKSWYDGEILAGTEWEEAIASQLNAADIILLLISPDFIASDYCYETELMKALERHAAHRACVIPILLRPVDWDGTPFSRLQMLPTGTKAITLWPNCDEAFEDVARGIRKVITTFLAQKNQIVKTSAFPASLPFGSKLLQLSLWKVISFICLLILIVAILAIPQISNIIAQSSLSASTPKKTLTIFCESLRAGDYQTAYNQDSERSQASGGGFADITGGWKSNNGNGVVIDCSARGTDNDGSLSATNSVLWIYANHVQRRFYYGLIMENSVWKIDQWYDPGLSV